MKHKARKQKTAAETIEARKITVVSARKEEKDTVSWKHEPPSPSLWNNPRTGPLLITRGTALCLPVHFWHRGAPSTCWSGMPFHCWAKGIWCHLLSGTVPAERGRGRLPGGRLESSCAEGVCEPPGEPEQLDSASKRRTRVSSSCFKSWQISVNVSVNRNETNNSGASDRLSRLKIIQ